MKRLGWLLVFLLSAQPTFAADVGCGRDTDRNDTVDQACPTPDADFDGYTSVAGGCSAPNCDCDDNNSFIYPGVSTEGSSAGQFKTCQGSGSYTSSAANSTYSCKSGSGTDRWVDDAVANCGHAGTYADPNNYRCYFDTGMVGYTALSAGDCVIFQGGTYTDSYTGTCQAGTPSSTCMVVSRVAGNSTNQIHIEAEPGKLVTIDSPGASPTKVIPIELDHAYWTINGNAIGKRPGFAVGFGYAASGIYITAADNATVGNVFVDQVDGNCGSDNCGGIKLDSGSDNASIHHNHVKDTYNRTTGPTSENSSNIEISYGVNNSFTYNTLEASSTSVVGQAGIFYKHCEQSVANAWTFRGNIVINGGRNAINTACGGATVDHNLIITPALAGIIIKGGNGNNNFMDASTIELNTVKDSWPMEVFIPESREQMIDSFTATAATDIIVTGAYDWTASNIPVIVQSTTTLPSPLVAGTTYYAVRQSGNNYKLSTASDGSAIVDITDTGTGTHFINRKYGVITTRKNVWQDNRGTAYTAPGDYSDGWLRICHHCTDRAWRAMQLSPLATVFNSNDHYNSAAQALASTLFGDNSGAGTGDDGPLFGTTYANFAAWQASGMSTSEVSEDPQLDAYYIARSANTLNWGWRPASGLVVEGGGGGGSQTTNIVVWFLNNFRRRR